MCQAFVLFLLTFDTQFLIERFSYEGRLRLILDFRVVSQAYWRDHVVLCQDRTRVNILSALRRQLVFRPFPFHDTHFSIYCVDNLINKIKGRDT